MLISKESVKCIHGHFPCLDPDFPSIFNMFHGYTLRPQSTTIAYEWLLLREVTTMERSNIDKLHFWDIENWLL